MDDFILPEEIDEENTDSIDLDSDGNESNVLAGDDQKLVPESGTELSVVHCAEAMSEVLQKYEKVKERIAELDQLAMQLSFGVRLQAEMDKCASERRNFPLHITLERQKLSSGSSVLIIRLQNNSLFEMIDWHLALTTSLYQTAAVEEKDRIFTKVIPVKQLSQHSEFSYETFCTIKLPTSLFFRVQLFKCIYFSENREPRAFRVALEPIYLNHWDTVTVVATPKSNTNRAVLYERVEEEQKITLPEALVYLICDEEETEEALLKWIINTSSEGCESTNCIVLDDDNISWPFAIKVKKQGLNYDVVLTMKNAKLRCNLINELQIRILIRMRYIWKELKEKEDCELLFDNNSLSDCFASLIAKYRR